MSDAASVTITGMEELQKKLENLGKDFTSEWAESGKASMQRYVEREAKQKCPVDTGNLRASINTQIDGNSISATVKTGTTVEYAPDVEYGTSRQRAQPYLRPAFDEQKENVLNDIKKRLQGKIARYTQ